MSFFKSRQREKRVLRMVSEDEATFPFVEAYKSLRTNLEYIAATKNCNTFAITSAEPKDGKTTVSINLALTMASNGKRVVLVDGDLRKASVAHYLGISHRRPGITAVLSKEKTLKEVLIPWEDHNVDILPVGMTPPNPSELIGSVGMMNILEELSKEYDYVLVDTPPVTVVTDATVISRFVDGVILVARSEMTTKQILFTCKRILDDVNAQILGVVLNDYKPEHHSRSKGYYHNYHYRSYGADEK